MGRSLGRVNHLPVPLEGRCLVDESRPLGKGGIRPLGDVQVVDHLAAGAIASHALTSGNEAYGRIGLIDGGHHVSAHVDEGAREVIGG